VVEDDADADAATVTDAVVMLDALTGARKSNASTIATNNSFGINLMMRVLLSSVLVWIDARRTVSHWSLSPVSPVRRKLLFFPPSRANFSLLHSSVHLQNLSEPGGRAGWL
jgi:hypothetical protein